MRILIIFLTAIASVVAAETGFLPLSLGLGEKVHAETQFVSASESQPGVELKLTVDRRVIIEDIEDIEDIENVENVEDVEDIENVENVENVEDIENIEDIENKAGGGEPEFEWQPLSPETQVLPGDILRYRLVGKNNGSQPVSSLVLTQPIPPEMIYILGSAKGANNITFSIDNGVTFDANPMITSVNNRQGGQAAAPPENYTHVRWNFEQVLAPAEEFVGSFEVRVR